MKSLHVFMPLLIGVLLGQLLIPPSASSPVHIVENKTFNGSPGKEALEIDGEKGTIIRNCTFVGGSTNLRFVDCRDVVVENCLFSSMTGPADPDGQGIQFIRTTGQIVGCHFKASANTEDLCSIYADRRTLGVVLIENCTFAGKGDSDSGTSICLDGVWCPTTTISNCAIKGARCGITVAGGANHVIEGVTMTSCENSLYIANMYRSRKFGPFTVKGCALGSDILFGPGAKKITKITK